MATKRKVTVHKFDYSDESLAKLNELLSTLDMNPHSVVQYRDNGIFVNHCEEVEDFEIETMDKTLFFQTTQLELKTIATAFITHRLDLREAEAAIAELEVRIDKEKMGKYGNDRLRDAKAQKLMAEDSIKKMGGRIVAYTQLLQDLKDGKIQLEVANVLKEQADKEAAEADKEDEE